MNLKSKFDFKSIRFKLWVYFIGFALLLIGLIWFLQIFFLDNYYEQMKTAETTKLADQIIDTFQDGDGSLLELTRTLEAVSAANGDIYVRVETGDGSILISPDYSGHGPLYQYSLQVQALRNKLESGSFSRVSMITPNPEPTTILRFWPTPATCIRLPTVSPKSRNHDMSYILFIFSPLYPVKSTVSIMRVQLVYITVIASLLALTLALYLARRISRPIKEITHSAAEMGKGNYGVKFKGGHYSGNRRAG